MQSRGRFRYLIALAFLGALVCTQGDERSRIAIAAPVQAPDPFLYPPFPGAASEESIFDHTSPNYNQTDGRIFTTSGDTAYKICPSPEPPGTRPPMAGVCDQGNGIYWSYSLGDWTAYNGHDGVDYGINYRPVYAAADSDQVMYAGWWDPQNHSTALGIYVKLHHANGYITTYGHMSAIAVQACPTVGCAMIGHGEMLGISGNTGNSTGPHLHFQLTSPEAVSVDPYGWTGSGIDPWPYNSPISSWVMYPKLTSYGISSLPSGSISLGYPPAAPSGILVDDSSTSFEQDPMGCWTSVVVSSGQAQNSSMKYVKPRVGVANCTARWRFPKNSPQGLYAVYVRIAAVHATSEGAVYKIAHAGQVHRTVINQAVYPNTFYGSDGWVYAGKYRFDGLSTEYVELGNGTQDNSSIVGSLELGADAVRFVFLGEPTPTPIPITLTATNTPAGSRTPTNTMTLTATRTPTPSSSATITRTSTASITPMPSRTATASRTPTITRTPTATWTPSRTPTASRTPTSTVTRPPTATPLYTKLKVYLVNTVLLRARTPPYEVAGYRWAKSSDNFARVVLDEYFKGPGYTEQYVYRWTTITSGFTGYDKFEVADSIARVYLRGHCAPSDLTYTIAQLLMVNLKQFSHIQYVKIFDEMGRTENPNEARDSIPICLDPLRAPTRTPTPTMTPTPTATPTRTRTPTVTPRPTATPAYRLLDVYFFQRTTLLQVAGKRWAPTSANLPEFILDAYFKGPGYTEKYVYGWIAIYNGVTGYSKVEVNNGIARVYLTGKCDSKGSTFSIAQPLMSNLRQFKFIQFVKIYDENGNTEVPDGFQDSIPGCLEP